MEKGIDVGRRYLDIRLIVLKHFAVAGVHPEDLVQEVVLGILHRNRLPGSAYDPGRGAFGTYVYLVAKNVSARLARREAREIAVRSALAERTQARAGALNGWPTSTLQTDPIAMPTSVWVRRTPDQQERA